MCKVVYHCRKNICEEYKKEKTELRHQNSSLIKEVSQLKEANNKLNYAMIEWDTTHPIEAENRELQKRVKKLTEVLEKIAQMSDSGSYENTIISMKSIATQALKEKE